MLHRVAPQRKISPITITTFATLLCVCPPADRPVVGRSVVRANRIILYLSHDSCRFMPQRSERRVYRSVKCKLSGNVNKMFNVVGIVESNVASRYVPNRYGSVSSNWEQSNRRKTVIRFDYLLWERTFFFLVNLFHSRYKHLYEMQLNHDVQIYRQLLQNILAPKLYFLIYNIMFM